MKVLQFPLSRITISFIPGIIAAHYFKPKFPIELLPLLLLLLAGLVIAIYFRAKKFRKNIYFGIAIYLLFFLTGTIVQLLHNESNNPNNYSHKIAEESPQVLKVILREKLKSSLKGQRFIAKIKSVDGENTAGSILLMFSSKIKREFTIGTVLLIKVKVYKSRPPLNPDQFDYGKYLENKSIYAQAKVNEENILRNQGIYKDLWYYSDFMRQRMIANLRQSGFSNDALAVVAALILGQQQDISPEVLHDYQYAGAIHILSVSGLHVGFILLFLNFMLKGIPNNKHGVLSKFIVILLALWAFALIAGFSPSVVRSVTMFSFVAWGMYLRRSTNIFHTLLVSLLLILMFKPSFLFDVGFQLSYTALFFILWLQPLFSGLWSPKYKPVRYLWDILTVSFAAQIGAFPLSIYYFHQFPALFFLTNIVVIPFLGIIMSLGLVVLILAGFNYVPSIPANVLEWCIRSLNKAVGYIASYEDFIIPDIPFSFYMLVTCYLMIVTATYWFIKPKYKKFIAAVISIFIFQATVKITLLMADAKREIIVFNANNSTLISERKGKNVIVYSDMPDAQKDPKLKSYVVANFCKLRKCQKIDNYIPFYGNQILVIDSSAVYPKKFLPDALLLIQSPKINLQRLIENSRPKIVVADGSNYKSYIEKWESTCLKEKIPFHYTGEKGFYKISGSIKL